MIIVMKLALCEPCPLGEEGGLPKGTKKGKTGDCTLRSSQFSVAHRINLSATAPSPRDLKFALSGLIFLSFSKIP